MDDYPELEVYDEANDQYVDFTQFMTEGGLSVTAVDKEHDVETMDGTTHRGRYITKWKLSAACHALNDTNTATVLRLLKPEYITVRYINPELGRVIASMMVKERPTKFRRKITNGRMWDGMTFTLQER